MSPMLVLLTGFVDLKSQFEMREIKWEVESKVVNDERENTVNGFEMGSG